MNICLGTDALYHPHTGIGRYTGELATRLLSDSSCDEVHFYVNGNFVSFTDLKPLKKTILRKYFPSLFWRSYSKKFIFHSPNYFIPKWTSRSLSTVHDLSVFKYPDTHPKERVDFFKKNFFDSVDRATLIITDTETVRSELLDYIECDPEKIISIPLGVSSSFFCTDNFSSLEYSKFHPFLRYKSYSLSVGTLEPRKNLISLIKAYSLLPMALRKEIPLVLIGTSGWCNTDLMELIDSSINEGWLICLGDVPESALPFLYKGARLFIFPSIYEGFGLPVIEAMAAKTPVLVSEIDVLKEITFNKVGYFDPYQIEDIKSKIYSELMLDINTKSADLLHISSVVSNAYSWDVCYKKTHALYSSLL